MVSSESPPTFAAVIRPLTGKLKEPSHKHTHRTVSESRRQTLPSQPPDDGGLASLAPLGALVTPTRPSSVAGSRAGGGRAIAAALDARPDPSRASPQAAVFAPRRGTSYVSWRHPSNRGRPTAPRRTIRRHRWLWLPAAPPTRARHCLSAPSASTTSPLLRASL